MSKDEGKPWPTDRFDEIKAAAKERNNDLAMSTAITATLEANMYWKKQDSADALAYRTDFSALAAHFAFLARRFDLALDYYYATCASIIQARASKNLSPAHLRGLADRERRMETLAVALRRRGFDTTMRPMSHIEAALKREGAKIQTRPVIS